MIDKELSSIFKSCADEIRSKGVNGTFTPYQLSSGIHQIQTGNYNGMDNTIEGEEPWLGDGDTHIWWEIPSSDFDILSTDFAILYLKYKSSVPVSVDWGDGSEVQVFPAKTTSYNGISQQHYFKRTGSIRLDIKGIDDNWTGNGGWGIFCGCNGRGGPMIASNRWVKWAQITHWNSESTFNNPIRANVSLIGINLSSDTNIVPSFKQQMFHYSYNLRYLYFPKGLTELIGGIGSPFQLRRVKVPSTVTSMNGYTFQNAFNMVECDISECTSLSVIGNYCFNCCRSLNRIDIPDSVQTIGSYAFQDSHSLRYVHIPENIKSFGPACFAYCNNIREFLIPDNSVSSIPQYFCRNSYSLVNLHLPKGVKIIGDCAFQNSYMLSSLSIPSSVVDIQQAGFSNCHQLRTLEFEEGSQLSVINNSVFACPYLLTDIDIPDSVQTIGNGAFDRCQNLVNLHLPESLLSIGQYAFRGSWMLKELEIPEGTKYIGQNAFDEMFCCKKITIPSTMEYLGQYSLATYGNTCWNPVEVIINATTPPQLQSANLFSNSTPQLKTGSKIKVPKGCLTAYQTAQYWSNLTAFMEEQE